MKLILIFLLTTLSVIAEATVPKYTCTVWHYEYNPKIPPYKPIVVCTVK